MPPLYNFKIFQLLFFYDQFLDKVISNVRDLWPECRMVRGSPCHTTTNGGIERFNQTMEKQLGAWMKDNQALEYWMQDLLLALQHSSSLNHQEVSIPCYVQPTALLWNFQPSNHTQPLGYSSYRG